MRSQILTTLVVILGLPLWLTEAAPASSPTHGVASGDVQSTSARIWARGGENSLMCVEYSADPEFAVVQRAAPQPVTSATDFTGLVSLEKLQPATRYYYRVWFAGPKKGDPATEAVAGTFVTAAAADQARDVSFVWGADLGGQNNCRHPVDGYPIFATLLAFQPDFFLFEGDTIYADNRCTSPPNAPGGDFIATTLPDYRRKYRYNREDVWHQELLKATSVYAIWDDHEVVNDFSGPFQPLMPIGRQAFFEYWPVLRLDEPGRLYRHFRWGRDMELFIVDTRQYRSRNSNPDGPDKTMLGAEQLQWLKDSLRLTTATWKVIATGAPISVPGGSAAARDTWARGTQAGEVTGFERELLDIVQHILANDIRNVVWVATDVHHARVLAHDPDRDGTTDFHEIISGPLSASRGNPGALSPTLNPTSLYGGGGFFNFGWVYIDSVTQDFYVAIIEGDGSVRYITVFNPR